MSTTICIHILDQTATPSVYTFELSDYDKHNTCLREFLGITCANVGCDDSLYSLIRNTDVVGVDATLATLARMGDDGVPYSSKDFSAIRLLQPLRSNEKLYGGSAMSLVSVRDTEIISTGLTHECLYVFCENRMQSIFTTIANAVINMEKREGRDKYADMPSLARMSLLTAELSLALPQVPPDAWQAIHAQVAE